MDFEQLAERFQSWAVIADDYDSPLYGVLSRGVAQDEAVMALAAQKMASQPVENMLFAAVHYLLMRDESAELRHYYPNLTDTPLPTAEAYPAFRAYCLDHKAKILHLIQTRRTQTNAVRRCTFLRPAFHHVARLLDNQPFAQIEMGCSAGLNLQWDRYGYHMGTHIVGNVVSPVQLAAELRGDRLPPLHETVRVIGRIGLDLNPLDVTDSADADWLTALIWPELNARRTLLQAAIAVVQQRPVELVAGDGIEQIVALAAQFPVDVPLVIYHSFVLYQFSAADRLRYFATLDQLAATRPLYCIDAGWIAAETPTPQMHLYTWHNGQHQKTKLANMDAHGRWLEWLV